MELRNLRTFQAVANYLNFTRAAEELNFTQPTVTSQMQILEQELKQKLFLHLGKKTFLTPAGKILKEYADQLIELMNQIDTTFAELSHTEGNLIIAASETFCTHYFPRIISEYLSNYPNVHIKLLSCHTKEVIAGIESNKFDVGIISGELLKKGITNILLAEEESLVLIVSKDLFDDRTIDELFFDLPFIRYRVDGEFETKMQEFIKESNLRPRKILEFGSLEAVKKAVQNRIGIGLISENLVKQEITNRELVSIKVTGRPVTVQTSLITLTEKSASVTIKTFSETVRSMWNKIHEVGT